jgi:hypothetical protein
MAALDSDVQLGEPVALEEQLQAMPDLDHYANEHDVSMDAAPKHEEDADQPKMEEDADKPNVEGGGPDDAPKEEEDVPKEEEDAPKASEDAPMDDLFGEDEDEKAASVDDGLTDEERQRRQALEYEEPDEEPEGALLEEVIEAAVALPKVPLPRSSDGTVSPRILAHTVVVLILRSIGSSARRTSFA